MRQVTGTFSPPPASQRLSEIRLARSPGPWRQYCKGGEGYHLLGTDSVPAASPGSYTPSLGQEQALTAQLGCAHQRPGPHTLCSTRRAQGALGTDAGASSCKCGCLRPAGASPPHTPSAGPGLWTLRELYHMATITGGQWHTRAGLLSSAHWAALGRTAAPRGHRAARLAAAGAQAHVIQGQEADTGRVHRSQERLRLSPSFSTPITWITSLASRCPFPCSGECAVGLGEGGILRAVGVGTPIRSVGRWPGRSARLCTLKVLHPGCAT